MSGLRRAHELEKLLLGVEDYQLPPSSDYWGELTRLCRRIQRVPECANKRELRDFLRSWVMEEREVPDRVFEALWDAERTCGEVSPDILPTLLTLSPKHLCPKADVSQEFRLRGPIHITHTVHSVGGIAYDSREEAQMRASETGEEVATATATVGENWIFTYAHGEFREWDADPRLLPFSPDPEDVRGYLSVDLQSLYLRLQEAGWYSDFIPGSSHCRAVLELHEPSVFALEFPDATVEYRDLIFPRPLTEYDLALVNWLLEESGLPNFEE